MEAIQIVVFSLNDETCGVDTSQVKEIIMYENLTKMPKMPDFVDGVINLRGAVVPVVNLNKRFELGDIEISKKTKIIITQLQNRPIGFIVNNVFEIFKLAPENIESTPKLIQKVDNAYLKCVGKKGDKLISILDLDAILTDIELRKLEQSRATQVEEEARQSDKKDENQDTNLHEVEDKENQKSGKVKTRNKNM